MGGPTAPRRPRPGRASGPCRVRRHTARRRSPRSRRDEKHDGDRLPLPLAEEGWGEGDPSPASGRGDLEAAPQGPPMIEVHALAKRFLTPGAPGRFSLKRPPPRIVQAVQDVSFRAPDGRITGLL